MIWYVWLSCTTCKTYMELKKLMTRQGWVMQMMIWHGQSDTFNNLEVHRDWRRLYETTKGPQNKHQDGVRLAHETWLNMGKLATQWFQIHRDQRWMKWGIQRTARWSAWQHWRQSMEVNYEDKAWIMCGSKLRDQCAQGKSDLVGVNLVATMWVVRVQKIYSYKWVNLNLDEI